MKNFRKQTIGRIETLIIIFSKILKTKKLNQKHPKTKKINKKYM